MGLHYTKDTIEIVANGYGFVGRECQMAEDWLTLHAERDKAKELVGALRTALAEHDDNRKFLKKCTDLEYGGDYTVADQPWAGKARAALAVYAAEPEHPLTATEIIGKAGQRSSRDAVEPKPMDVQVSDYNRGLEAAAKSIQEVARRLQPYAWTEVQWVAECLAAVRALAAEPGPKPVGASESTDHCPHGRYLGGICEDCGFGVPRELEPPEAGGK
jgi:hypothetical protein